MAISASKSTTLYANTGAPYSNATLTASFTETHASTSRNASDITVTATQKIGNANWSSSYNSSLEIYWWDDKSGERLVATTNVTSQGRNATITASGTISVPHHTNGNLSGYAKAVWTKGGSSAWTPNSGSVATNTTALTNIPRYATSNQSLNSKTETTITMNWSSDATVDYIWYSSNNGSSWTGIDVTDGKSGSYTISGLTANTTYNIKTRVRRKDSQLTSDSSALSVTTYAYPYANSMPNFTIGENVTIGLYNPLARSVTVYIVAADDSEKSGGTTASTSMSGWNSVYFQDFLYTSIPNAQSGTYKIKVVYGENTTTTTGGTYSVNPAVCSPTISAVSYQDTNSATTSVTQNNQLIVQKNSTVRYTATGLTANNSATLSSCSVSVNGNSYAMSISGTTATGGNATIDSSSNVTATVTLTDSRGLTATKDVTVQMLGWSIPTAIITLQRHNNFYSETDINVNADYASIDGKNTITIKTRYKKATDSSYGSYVILQDNVTSVLNLDNNYAWDVQVLVQDAFGSATYNTSISRGMPIIYFDKDLSSVGVNCFPVNEESLEVSGTMVIRSVMTRSLLSNLTNLSVNTYTKIALTGTNSFGNSLTATNDGGIEIGAGVSKILVSGRMLISSNVVGSYYIRICANSTDTTLGWVTHTNQSTAATFESIDITPTLVNVNEGDVIYMYYYVPTSSSTIYGTTFGSQTSLTVETVG